MPAVNINRPIVAPIIGQCHDWCQAESKQTNDYHRRRLFKRVRLLLLKNYIRSLLISRYLSIWTQNKLSQIAVWNLGPK